MKKDTNSRRYYPYCNYCKKNSAGHNHKYCRGCNSRIQREISICWQQFRPYELSHKESE